MCEEKCLCEIEPGVMCAFHQLQAEKRTKGPAKVQYETKVYVSVSNHGDVFVCDCYVDEGEILIPERKANAAFIAEAFNVAHETGMTPKQLVERVEEQCSLAVQMRRERDELLAALKALLKHPYHSYDSAVYTNARDAIAKVEGTN